MTPSDNISTTISVIAILFLFLLGVMYRVFADFIYTSAFVVKNTIDIKELSGEMRVGRFGIFIGLWVLLIIFNMSIFAIVFRKHDYANQAKLTSLLYVGIVATTFVIIGAVPGLVEVFENTFGALIISSPPTSWLFNYENTMKVFVSERFKEPNITIPFDYLLPMFNISNYTEVFDAIAGRKTEGDEKYDFSFDYDKMCTDGIKTSENAKNTFKNEFFKLCFAKHNAGHFVWVYIASVVTVLSTVAIM